MSTLPPHPWAMGGDGQSSVNRTGQTLLAHHGDP